MDDLGWNWDYLWGGGGGLDLLIYRRYEKKQPNINLSLDSVHFTVDQSAVELKTEAT